ncbi:MAG: hypothetical protein L0Y56_06270 [Nitrospira sp.]|nr:hypothetical protein [Nitrospira sp.]
MRKDMAKVLTERPRVGGAVSNKKSFAAANTPRTKRHFKGVKDDLSPKRESMRKRHRYRFGGKEFSDHIQPLRRYLESQAGRPWDKVWSDVCKRLKGNGLQAQHVKDHVKSYVGGIPHSGQTYFRNEEWFRPDTPVYVDKHGILRKGPKQ